MGEDGSRILKHDMHKLIEMEVRAESSQAVGKQKRSCFLQRQSSSAKWPDYESEMEEEDWIATQKREEEEEMMEEEDEEEDPLCPTYKFSKSQHKEDCEQWKKAIIIKLISAKFLMSRLEKMWGLIGVYELISLDSGHLLVQFKEDRDYLHVLQDGPWIVTEHYLIVQRWRPLFDPYDEEVKKLAV